MYRKAGGGVTLSKREGCSPTGLLVSCGQCRGCRIDKMREWTLRCVHEAQMHEDNCFVTLTYRSEDMPSDWSLRVRDWQLFVKRLRKKRGPFRYFHAGEYGEDNLRPHYHALLFGIDFTDRLFVEEKRKKGKVWRVYTSPELSSVWKLGYTTIGDLNSTSAAYVASYTFKKVNGQLAEQKYQRTDPETLETWHVKPEYVTMSLKPGIGAEWYEKYREDVYPDDFAVMDGRKFRPPTYYDRLLPEEELEVLKVKRRRNAGLHKEDLTPDRLRDREKVALAGDREFKRSV